MLQLTIKELAAHKLRLLSTAFAGAGFETICLRGVAATHAVTPVGASVLPFTTNDDLAEQLRVLGEVGDVAGVFHAAALCDYRVQRIDDALGQIAGGPLIGLLATGVSLRAALIVTGLSLAPILLLFGRKGTLSSEELALSQ